MLVVALSAGMSSAGAKSDTAREKEFGFSSQGTVTASFVK
jgi:hypothetical protein